MSHFAWLPCCNEVSPSDCWTLPQRTLACSAELLARFLQAFSISDSRQRLIRDTWGTGPTANFFHTLCICTAGWVKVIETTPGGTRSGYTGPSSYKGSVTKQQITRHRTATSWAPAIARKRKGSSPKAPSSFTFPRCHNWQLKLWHSTSQAPHCHSWHSASCETPTLSYQRVTLDPSNRFHRLSWDLPRLKTKPVSNETR